MLSFLYAHDNISDDILFSREQSFFLHKQTLNLWFMQELKIYNRWDEYISQITILSEIFFL